MIGEPKPEQSEAIVQARAKAKRLAGAFKSVFGEGDRRTAAQQLVMDHLSTCAGDDQNSYRFNDARDGLALIAAGIHRDGARSILRIIERQIQIASKEGDEKKPKPKTVR